MSRTEGEISRRTPNDRQSKRYRVRLAAAAAVSIGATAAAFYPSVHNYFFHDNQKLQDTGKIPSVSQVITPQMQVYDTEARAIGQLQPSELKKHTVGQTTQYEGTNNHVGEVGAPREKMTVDVTTNPKTGEPEVTFVQLELDSTTDFSKTNIIFANPQGRQEAAQAMKALGMKEPKKGQAVAAERYIPANKPPEYYNTDDLRYYAYGQNGKRSMVETASSVVDVSQKIDSYFAQEFVPQQDREALAKLISHMTSSPDAKKTKKAKEKNNPLSSSAIVWQRNSTRVRI